jgi:hypothetical protein
MNKMIYQINRIALFIVLIIALGMFSACEDVILVDSGFEKPSVVVDAWINTSSEPQTILVNWSQDYFDSSRPTGITDAQVVVRTGNNVHVFAHTQNGAYVWTPEQGQSIGSTGDVMDLVIEHQGEVITSQTEIHRVPPIDSISLVFEEEALGIEEGLYGELYARDFPGIGDTYWIRTYKNDTLLNRPQELTIIYDSTFDPGSGLDGLAFIRPLRLAINPLDEDGLFIPYEAGDHLKVELHSISNEAFLFLQVAQEQMVNGDNSIFSIPVANARGNIINTTSGDAVLGMFNVANVSKAERSVE